MRLGKTSDGIVHIVRYDEKEHRGNLFFHCLLFIGTDQVQPAEGHATCIECAANHMNPPWVTWELPS